MSDRMTICPACGGEGRVPVNTPTGPSTIRCERCNGTGKVPQRELLASRRNHLGEESRLPPSRPTSGRLMEITMRKAMLLAAALLVSGFCSTGSRTGPRSRR